MRNVMIYPLWGFSDFVGSCLDAAQTAQSGTPATSPYASLNKVQFEPGSALPSLPDITSWVNFTNKVNSITHQVIYPLF